MVLSTNPSVWKGVGIIFILLTLLLVALIYFKTIFILLILGAVITWITDKGVNRVERLVHWKLPGVIQFIVIVIMALLVIGAGVYVMDVSAKDIAQIWPKESQEFLDSIAEAIEVLLPSSFGEDIAQNVRNLDESVVQKNIVAQFNNVLSIGQTLFSLLAQALLIIPLMMYAYFSRKSIVLQQCKDVLPKKYRSPIISTVQGISKDLNDFFSAKFIESSIIALICLIGFKYAGLKGWLFLGIFAGVLNIIPYLGPLIGAIPPIFIALLQDPHIVSIVALTLLVAQIIDNVYLIPFMISGKVNVDPLVAIIITLVGAKVLGPLGMIVAVPIFLVYERTLLGAYRFLKQIYT